MLDNKIIIPIFPLDGVIFFPQSNLPLNIFQERYIEMIDFSLSTNKLIGMIQSDSKGNFYSVGCIGKINSFSETAEGKYVVNLVGKNYFTVNKKLSNLDKFISAEIEIISPNKYEAESKFENFDKKALINKYRKYTENLNIGIDFNLIEEIEIEELIKFIAMSCSFSKEDKQMLEPPFSLTSLAASLPSSLSPLVHSFSVLRCLLYRMPLVSKAGLHAASILPRMLSN